MQAIDFQQPGRAMRVVGLATLLMLVSMTGLYIVRSPNKAWAILGAVAVLALLECSAVYWAVGAVLAATLSRVAVAVGAPHFLNFLHFPLVLGAFAVALLKGQCTLAAKRIRICLWVFLAVNVVSWLINDGELLRPILNWLVLVEPFLLLYALLVTPLTEGSHSSLWKVLLAVCFIQVPIGLYQRAFVSHGNPDLVQGTFIASGTGAHVAGAVTMLGVIALVCQATAAESLKVKLWCYAGAVPLLGLAVIADAKQSIIAFIPGLFFAVLAIKGIRLSSVVLPGAFLTVLLLSAFYFYQPLQIVLRHRFVSAGLEGKVYGFQAILHGLDEKPLGWLIGLGPGNTVSRVALLTPDAQLDGTSSVAALGLKTAPLTRKLLRVSYRDQLWRSSSAWSPICSWFGLIGDLGLLGVMAYLLMLGIAWRTAGAQGYFGVCAKGALIAMAILGGVYPWLEEPGFTLLLVLLISPAWSISPNNPLFEFRLTMAPRAAFRHLLGGSLARPNSS